MFQLYCPCALRIADAELELGHRQAGDGGGLTQHPLGRPAAGQAVRDLREQRLQAAWANRFEPAVTRDGHAVEVFANIGESSGIDKVVEQGAEGVGLLRTELIFMAHSQAPDVATQEAEYRRVLDGLGGRPLVVRTLDVGGDKPLPYWPIAAEENPFLGVRGVRLTLQRPQIMEDQLRALLRAADQRPLRIMFPMVGQVHEWREARAMVERLRLEIPVADRLHPMGITA